MKSARVSLCHKHLRDLKFLFIPLNRMFSREKPSRTIKFPMKIPFDKKIHKEFSDRLNSAFYSILLSFVLKTACY